MKKLVLTLAVTSALGLSACDDETIADVKKDVAQNNETVVPTARVVFAPADGILSPPNDLLFTNTIDGTINIPDLDETDYSNPLVAANALDGWATQQPFPLPIDFPAGVSLDGGSVFSPNSVHMYEVIMGGSQTDADCAPVPAGVACKYVGELTFGVDFITRALGNSVGIIPLKPLKGETTYIMALTNNLKDSNGNAVAGSTTYELVRQDSQADPLGSAAQRGLQAVINSYEDVIAASGIDSDSIIYTAAMTTGSTTRVLETVKQLYVANPAAMPAVTATDTGATVADILVGAGQIPADNAALVGLYSSAKLMTGSVTLPYYLGIPTAENPLAPVSDFWTANCDSGATLSGVDPALLPTNPISDNDGFCMQFGLRDVGVDVQRHVTRYNPIPKVNAMVNLDVQMTMPNVNVATAVRASMGLDALVEPAGGWPVVIMQHGITSKKEDMLAMTGILSVFGFATAAIDHPLHGSRGFDLDPTSPGDEINASTVSATHYMNLGNLLATRDNGRQSVADLLGFRLGLNFMPGIDGSNVHFLGHSLGAIAGTPFTALANNPLNPAIDGLFKLQTSSLAMPGGAVANFLFDSPAFGDLIRASLLNAASPDFQGFVAAQAAAAGIAPGSPGFEGFLAQTFRDFWAILTPAQQAPIQGSFDQFIFAAQSITEAMDPNNYAQMLVDSGTPVHLIEVVGDGAENLQDQVIPNGASGTPLGGTEGLIGLLGLPGISTTTAGAEPMSGVVRYLKGHHGSILTPAPNSGAPDPVATARATQEMQTQVATYFATGGTVISVSDPEIVK